MKNNNGELTSIETRFYHEDIDTARDDYLQQLQEIELQLTVVLETKLSMREREHGQALLDTVNAGKQVIHAMSLRMEKLRRIRGRM